jgi:hypothetical protein
MPAAKDPQDRFLVYAVRIPARDLAELKTRKIVLGPLVRELVRSLLKKGEVKWKAISK